MQNHAVRGNMTYRQRSRRKKKRREGMDYEKPPLLQLSVPTRI